MCSGSSWPSFCPKSLSTGCKCGRKRLSLYSSLSSLFALSMCVCVCVLCLLCAPSSSTIAFTLSAERVVGWCAAPANKMLNVRFLEHRARVIDFSIGRPTEFSPWHGARSLALLLPSGAGRKLYLIHCSSHGNVLRVGKA
jgi:hypothetical protein